MEGIADFLDSLIGGVDLICYSLAIGGVLWGLFVLRPWEEIDHQAKAHGILADKTIRLIYKGAFALAIVQLLKIILKVWLMAAILDRWPFPEFASTTQFIGGIIRMMLALLLALVTYTYLRKQANSYKHWLNTALVLGLLLNVVLLWQGRWHLVTRLGEGRRLFRPELVEPALRQPRGQGAPIPEIVLRILLGIGKGQRVRLDPPGNLA